MITHEDMPQGSAEWLAHRSNHFNASDAPAMMGVSPYETRSELLHRLATGITKDIDPATQRRFDDGHRCEALARPLAEMIIGSKLYPVVVSEGNLSASMDGLTMNEKTGFEHKRLNNSIRHIFANNEPLLEYHRIQMEQQLAIIEDCENILFMASEWDEHGEIVGEALYRWYETDIDLRASIIAGWAQLEKDRAAYVPPEVILDAVATPTLDFPIPSIELGGSIALKSNLTSFGEQLKAYIAALPTKPSTDQEFVDCKAALSKLKEAELALDSEEARALAQLTEIDAMRREKKLYSDLARTTRLSLEKLVAAQEAAIKGEILAEARREYALRMAALEVEIEPIRLVCKQPDFAGAMKNKRTLASLQDAVNTTLALGKIDLDAAAGDMRAKLVWVHKHADAHRFLLNDLQQIIQKPVDDFTLLVNSRIDAHKKAEADKVEAAKVAEEARMAAAVEAERKAGEARAAAAIEAERMAAAKLAAEAAQKQSAEDQRGKADEARPTSTQTSVLYETASVSTPPTSEEKRAAVIEHQDEIAEFLNYIDVDEKKRQSIRPYLVEFIKWQASRRAMSMGKRIAA